MEKITTRLEDPISVELERFTAGCRVGRGEQVRAIDTSTQLGKMIVAEIGVSALLAASDSTILTPFDARHPMVAGARVNRGVRHDRSFCIPLFARSGKQYSLTVKGGDLHHEEGVKRGLVRLKKHQIPGACLMEENVSEFDAAMTLQELACAKLGRFTHAPLPLSIRQHTLVPNSHGMLVSVQEFMNSAEYPVVNQERREWWGLPEEIPLGDLVIDKYALQPSEYLYLIEGLDIRANELPSMLYYEHANNYFGYDSLSHNTGGLFKYACEVDHDENDFDTVIRSAYRILGMAYGFPADDILPTGAITEQTYIHFLRDIPRQCTVSGIDSIVLGTLIDRVTEVVALGHSAGYYFSSSNRDTGGSLVPRNITFHGIVLDLDTFRPFDNNTWKFLYKDFNELLLSIACISRMVTPGLPKDILTIIRDSYMKKVQQFCTDPCVLAKIEQAISRTPEWYVIEALEFSRNDLAWPL